MIIEQRDYHVYTGKLNELIEHYAQEGIEIQKEVLGDLIGWFTTDVGELSTVVSMWRYSNFADREERRAALKADPRWPGFMAKIQPLIHTQRNRILIPTSFSPLQ
jgi:hypothetical protein